MKKKEKKPNDVDSKITKDIYFQFMKGKCSLNAKLIKLDQKIRIKYKNNACGYGFNFYISWLVESDGSQNKHNSACFCLQSVFHYHICC